MRKTTKGALAVGAGVALLLGGAGTLAYWQDSAQIAPSGTIIAGDLDIAAGSGTWAWSDGSTGFSQANSRIVPGDKVAYTQTFTVKTQGDHLKALLSTTGLPAPTAAVPATGNNLVGALGVTAALTVSPATGATIGGTPSAPTIAFVGGQTVTTYTVTAKVIVDFPFGTTGVDPATNGATQSVSLSNATVNLVQQTWP
jgi:alternate signal-mediated exported protein